MATGIDSEAATSEHAKGDEARFAVLLAEPPRLVDARRVADAVAPCYPELAAVDVRTRCRYAGGVVEERAPPAHAEALVEALAAAGLEARAVPQAALPPLEAPCLVDAIDLDDEGLAVRLRAAGSPTRARPLPHRIAWSEVRQVIPFALVELFRKPGHAVAEAGGAPERWLPPHKRWLDLLRPRRLFLGTPPLAGGLRARLRPDDAAAERALEGSPLGPDAERLQYSLARMRQREGREPRLGIDLLLAAEPGRAPTVLRLERGQFTWPGAHEAQSLEVLCYLGKRLIAGAAHAPPLGEHALVAEGLVDAALFLREEELRRYERWLCAAEPPP